MDGLEAKYKPNVTEVDRQERQRRIRGAGVQVPGRESDFERRGNCLEKTQRGKRVVQAQLEKLKQEIEADLGRTMDVGEEIETKALFYFAKAVELKNQLEFEAQHIREILPEVMMDIRSRMGRSRKGQHRSRIVAAISDFTGGKVRRSEVGVKAGCQTGPVTENENTLEGAEGEVAATVRSTGTESETDESSRAEDQLNECMRCGACCLHMGYPHYLPEEVSALPKEIRDVIDWFETKDPRYRGGYTPCYFFNMQTRKCIIHGQNKPKVCIDFEPGGESCEDLRNRWLPEFDWLNEALF